MKQTLTTVFLSVLIVTLCVFLYKMWDDMRSYKSLYEQQITSTLDVEKKYNQAKVIISDRDIKIDVLDKQLAEEMKKVKVKKITEVVYLTATVGTEGSGEATQATEDTIAFQDHRLSLELSLKDKSVRYSLLQKFRVNLYEMEGNDYRAEIAELNRETGELIGTYQIDDFVVIKKNKNDKSLQTGFNLSVAGAAYYAGEFAYTPYLSANFISYGKSHLDSDWRFLTLGVGLRCGILEPVSYRISNHIPLFSDLYLNALIVGDWRTGEFGGGLGIGSTF